MLKYLRTGIINRKTKLPIEINKKIKNKTVLTARRKMKYKFKKYKTK